MEKNCDVIFKYTPFQILIFRKKVSSINPQAKLHCKLQKVHSALTLSLPAHRFERRRNVINFGESKTQSLIEMSKRFDAHVSEFVVLPSTLTSTFVSPFTFCFWIFLITFYRVHTHTHCSRELQVGTLLFFGREGGKTFLARWIFLSLNWTDFFIQLSINAQFEPFFQEWVSERENNNWKNIEIA